MERNYRAKYEIAKSDENGVVSNLMNDITQLVYTGLNEELTEEQDIIESDMQPWSNEDLLEIVQWEAEPEKLLVTEETQRVLSTNIVGRFTVNLKWLEPDRADFESKKNCQ